MRCLNQVPVDRVKNAIAVVMVDNPDKVQQATRRPQLMGWFVGHTMKRLNGAADPQEVCDKVVEAFSIHDDGSHDRG